MISAYVFKADEHTRMVFSKLISCYKTKVTTGNIFLIPKEESIAIVWGSPSILQANLKGYRKLLNLNQVVFYITKSILIF